MRILSLLNQKGGVGKTTTTVNLGAALALEGCRVVVVDLDPQANLSVHLGVDLKPGEASSYAVLLGHAPFQDALRPTSTPGLSVVATDLDLSGAELELANQFGRETLLRESIAAWRDAHRAQTGEDPADYVLLDCAPSLGLLSINALAASDEVLICVQTEFFALRGLSKLIDVVTLVQRRLHPGLKIGGILPCLYDSRLKLAREVLAELKSYFGERVFARSIGVNVKLAEAPSYGQTIFEYAPDSPGARDYRTLAVDLLARDGVTPTPRPAPPRATHRPPPPRPAARAGADDAADASDTSEASDVALTQADAPVASDGTTTPADTTVASDVAMMLTEAPVAIDVAMRPTEAPVASDVVTPADVSPARDVEIAHAEPAAALAPEPVIEPAIEVERAPAAPETPAAHAALPDLPDDVHPEPRAYEAPRPIERLGALARYAYRALAGDVTPEGEVRDVLIVPRRRDA